MKKIIFILAVVMTMVACKGDMGPMGPQGKQGEQGHNGNWMTKTFIVKKYEWILVGEPRELNSYYYVDVKISELTNSIFKDGTVIGYMETRDNIKNGLPYVLHKGEKDGAKEFLWTQTYDFDFAPGKIRFYCTFSDFETENLPDDEKFYIVLMWE